MKNNLGILTSSQNYKYPKTPELVANLKPFWQQYHELKNKFCKQVSKLEVSMSKATHIPGMIFFQLDGESHGIGNLCRDMELITDRELERD